MPVILLVGSLIGLILLIVAQNLWNARPWRRPEEARWDFRFEDEPPRSELRIFERWPCPACGRPLGRASRFGRVSLPDRVIAFEPHVTAICGHCHFHNFLDKTGHPMIEGGIPPDALPAVWFEDVSERWDRLARATPCPRCGASYPGWDGSDWCRSLEKIEGATEHGPVFRFRGWDLGPILRCEGCGASASFLETDGRLVPERSHPDG